MKTIFIFLLFIFISSCSIIDEYNNKSPLPSYFYKEWIQSYEGGSNFNSTQQIYRPPADITQLSGYTMRYKFNRDGSCLFWALKQHDEYKMESCKFTFKNKKIYINDTSTTGGYALKVKPFEILMMNAKKMVIINPYKLP